MQDIKLQPELTRGCLLAGNSLRVDKTGRVVQHGNMGRRWHYFVQEFQALWA